MCMCVRSALCNDDEPKNTEVLMNCIGGVGGYCLFLDVHLPRSCDDIKMQTVLIILKGSSRGQRMVGGYGLNETSVYPSTTIKY